MRPPQIVFDALSFAVAHIFFWPVAALAVEWVFLHFCESLGLRYSWCFTAVIGLNALYAVASYGGKPEFRGDRFTQWFTTFWIGCHSYFPVRTLMWDGAAYADAPNEGHDKVFDVDKRTFVFAMHPHGAIPLGAAVFRPQIARWQKINAALRVGVASAAFYLPLMRDFYLWFGSIDASKRSLLHNIGKGRSVMLLPGGIREQLWVCKPGEDVTVIGDRKGFVKLALETGSALVPVYIFNERKAFVINRPATVCCSRLLKKLFGVGVPLVRGRWFTLMPFPVPITIVVGKPIDVPKVAAPTDDEVSALHARYIQGLQALYEEHRAACGHTDINLVIR